MDKSKLGGIAILLALGGVLFLSKSQDVPAPPADPDAAEHSEGDGHDHGGGDAGKIAPLPKIDLSGLVIKDLRPGTGAGAVEGDNLSMNYKGSLLSNGEVFDQSYGREPLSFVLGSGRVIKGWDYGIKGMKAGGKRKLTIPARLGYGEQGSPPKIPGGATLVFEVELLKISKPSG